MKSAARPSRPAVAALAALVVTAGCYGSGEDPSGRDRSEAAGSEEQDNEEQVAALEQSMPTGRYYWRGRPPEFTRRDGGVRQITAMEGTWTFVPTGCAPELCTGSVKSSSGSTYDFTWDGSAMVLKRKAERLPIAGCADSATGRTLSTTDSASTEQRTYDVGPVAVTTNRPGEPPARLAFEYRTRASSKSRDCRGGPDAPISWTQEIVLTRKRSS